MPLFDPIESGLIRHDHRDDSRKTLYMRLTKERAQRLREVFHNIVDHYGESKWNPNPPHLNLYSDQFDMWLGECDLDEEEVSVNLANLDVMRDVVRILIHEYIHYLQCPAWATRYDTMYDYWSNPYEIQAREIANRDLPLFWPQI